MKTICIVLCSMITVSSIAQTRLIAFKSHSGNMDHFSAAMENGLFNEEGSNFGNPPIRTIYYLDSIIYLSSSTAVLVQREYQYPWSGSKNNATLKRIKRDTVYSNRVFSKNHLLDSVRHLTGVNSFSEYETKSTVVVGYDNKKNPGKKKEERHIDHQPKEKNNAPIVTTVSNDPVNNSPFDAAMLKALAGIFLLAIIGGWLSTKFYSLSLQKA